jgi:uncharacterized protein YaaR (DUF327 family)
MTLLENLCSVNNQQGGTIHQFLSHNNNIRDVEAFKKAYKEFVEIGITFSSRKSFEKLAEQYHITINWEKK